MEQAKHGAQQKVKQRAGKACENAGPWNLFDKLGTLGYAGFTERPSRDDGPASEWGEGDRK